MRSFFLILLLLLSGFLPVFSQKQQSDEITNSQRARNFIDRIAPKLEITKSQKDSLANIFTQYMDDIEKYRAGNNAKIISYLMKARDEKVKNLLKTDAKYDKYLLVMSDIQKQQAPSQETHQGGGKGG